jgi:hypothetical protein
MKKKTLLRSPLPLQLDLSSKQLLTALKQSSLSFHEIQMAISTSMLFSPLTNTQKRLS